MRHTQVCPKCNGRRFAVQPKFSIPSYAYSNGTHVLPAVSVCTGWKRSELGHLEVWSCLKCGFTELYAAIGAMEQVARQFPEEVRIVDRTPPTNGPHR
ncbi:MAG: hypothetical protein AB8I08_25465 [Sandaracinaceae bacterium]